MSQMTASGVAEVSQSVVTRMVEAAVDLEGLEGQSAATVFGSGFVLGTAIWGTYDLVKMANSAISALYRNLSFRKRELRRDSKSKMFDALKYVLT